MTTFFLDLWHDLREKRLWPIAAGLALAIIAVPVALTKSSSEPSTAVTPPADQKVAHLPAVSLNPNAVASSHLDVFKERNPFKPLSDGVATVTVAGSPTSGTGVTAGPLGASGGTPSSSGGSSSSSSGSGGSASSGNSSSGGSSRGSSAPSAPSGKPANGGGQFFTFTADVRFGKLGHVHTYKGVSQLALLPPDTKSAVLSFYAVKDGAKAAVFFNYRGLSADGEGKCSDSCNFISLKPGQEETLRSGNRTAYSLKLLAIHTREVSKAQAVGKASPDTTAKAASSSKKHKDATLLDLPRVAFKL